ncbi:large-conductance mechanosensitive channel [Powellomyces hirtus]|nr:large-conductance mechanosensitive channel [Powellomyces hirtus]
MRSFDDQMPLRDVPKKNKFPRPVLPVTQISNGAKKGVKAVTGVVGDFREFLNRGNVVDLAVGLVMGAAFTSIVTSFISDIITPFISLATRANLGNNFLILRCPMNNATKIYPDRSTCVDTWAVVSDAQKAGAITWNWGSFVQVVMNFIIISMIIFVLVKFYAAAFRRQAADPKTKKCEFCCKDIPIEALRCFLCCKDVDLEPPIEDDVAKPDAVVVVDRWNEKKTY